MVDKIKYYKYFIMITAHYQRYPYEIFALESSNIKRWSTIVHSYDIQ